MPLDAITITALSNELNAGLAGMKIDKVQQPAKDLLIFSLRGAGRTEKLLISGGNGVARVHLTGESFENPQTPPMFCMLLRKHLVGARIGAVLQPDRGERMMLLELDGYDDMGEAVKKKLVFEMLGRSSNVILVGGDGIIIDCLRRVDGDMSRERQVMPGMLYRFPPKQDKPGFLETPSELRRALWDAAPGDRLTDKWLLDSFSGLSPLVCRELSFAACGDVSKQICTMTPDEGVRFLEAMDALAGRVSSGNFVPVMLQKDEKPSDFSFMPIFQYENICRSETYPCFSELLDAYYSRREKQEQMRRKSQSLLKSVKSAHERALRKLAARRQELEKTGERDYFRKCGELITAKLYRITKGDRSLEADDYYEEGCPKLLIKLDPLKTPQQNAARYYRDYNKAKTAEQYLGELIAKGEAEEQYLASVIDEIERSEGETDISAIRRELTETGFIRAQKGKVREKIREAEPLRFRSTAGMEILVGRNNSQNDTLTQKQARRTDLWLHAQKIHGSHVILVCNGETPDEGSVLEAASLAAYYSQGRDGGRMPVDYTQVRFVKKPSGAMPGKVVYTDFSTVMAEPDEALAEKLRIK